MSDPWWPLRGLVWFLRHPTLWARPLMGQLLVLSGTLAIGVSTIWLAWPDPNLSSWTWTWRAGAALALGPFAAAVTWMLLAPVVMALVADHLAAEIRRRQGFVVDEGGWHSLPAALRMVQRTAAARLGWGMISLLSLFTGPLGPLITAYAMARVAALDAFDTALAAEDGTADHRQAGIIQHAGDRMTGAAVAAGLALLLSLTVIGWILWMPALVCGATLRRIALTNARGP